MSKMTWEYYRSRRGTSLKDFLTGCVDEQSAFSRFEKLNIEAPTEMIKEMFSVVIENEKQEKYSVNASRASVQKQNLHDMQNKKKATSGSSCE